MGSLLTNGYGVGVEGKNLVLKTQGRVYIKVKDRFYELKFKDEDLINKDNTENTGESTTSNIIFVDTIADAESLEYPGDGTLVISLDGSFYAAQDNTLVQIPIKLNSSDLTLNNLTINGQLILNNTADNSPVVINNPVLIPNLNAQYLNGKTGNEYAVKSIQENISGYWTFQNGFTFESATGQSYLADETQNIIYIDFTTGEIRCNRLTATELNVPNEDAQDTLVSGVGNEVWIGSEINIIQSEYLSDTSYVNNITPWTNYKLALTDGSLYVDEDTYTENFWNDVFFSSYNTENETYTLRDFTNRTIIDTANVKLKPLNKTIFDYQNLINGLRTDGDTSNYIGDIYKIEISSNVKAINCVPNSIIKTSLGEIGVILARENNYVYVKLLKENALLEGTRLISIGSVVQEGGIVFKSGDPSLSILKDSLDETSAAVYFGQLSKIDKERTGIGVIFKGTKAETSVIDPENKQVLDDYLNKSEINVENPVIKWGTENQSFSKLNDDGSGYLSNGKLRWSRTKLYLTAENEDDIKLDKVGIENSFFKNGPIQIEYNGSGHIGEHIEFNTGAVTKNLPLGNAGGDLTGQYPNPTIADGVITENNLSSELQEKIESGGSSSVEVEELKKQISTLQSNYNDLLARIVALENTVGTLNTTLENRLNGN